MPLTTSEQLTTLSDLLASRRQAILLAWRKAARADPEQMTGRALTLGQFLDHIPQILNAFELILRSRPGGVDARSAAFDKKEEEVKHGLHRWQQGYRLKELMSECGHLQSCLFEELGRIAAAHPELEPATVQEAYRQLLNLINDTISESAAQYERMQQAEAAGRVGDLVGALASVNEIEHRRATLIHQAVHDLNSDVLGVTIAATRISQTDMVETERVESAGFLQRAVQGLSGMLGELMELARLEAGQETRKIGEFDASTLITELCDSKQPIAHERGLFLKGSGPSPLSVEGDADKVRRLLKNLLVNALKYTESGGVTVNWGDEQENWWLMVKDTGPGMLSGPGTPMVAGLQEATASAKESDEKSAAAKGETSHVLPPPEENPTRHLSHHQPGEGIGLSIVKRLCELLDASLEIASSAEAGTTFRVVFPRRYRNAS
jgi:signal transduction histidine kinase